MNLSLGIFARAFVLSQFGCSLREVVYWCCVSGTEVGFQSPRYSRYPSAQSPAQAGLEVTIFAMINYEILEYPFYSIGYTYHRICM